MSNDHDVPPLELYGNPEISPSQFEALVADYFKRSTDNLTSQVIHDAHLAGADGDYQIDVLVISNIGGLEIKTLVECKKHKNAIKREVVEILESKLRSLGAHKGAIFSTSPFQSGAIRYAKARGIATIKVSDMRLIFETKDRAPKKTFTDAPTDFALHSIEATQEGISIKLLKGLGFLC